MIFVTVGTHEQQFNRLIKCVDEMVGNHVIDDQVIIQTGYSDYEPVNCTWRKLYSFDEMNRLVNEADIVITHGGPSSIFMPLQIGKIPIVVPRQKKYDEHVNNHQYEFVQFISKTQRMILPVWEIEDLQDTILSYKETVKNIPCEMTSNNAKFCDELEQMAKELLGEK